MTRREVLGLMPAAMVMLSIVAEAEPVGEEYTEFIRRVNDFTVNWNLVMNNVLEGRWDMKLADKTVEAFKQVIDHPMWMRKKIK